MNSKKKNKNKQNKPPNPTPPQKKEETVETVSPPGEKIEEKVESVVEERVPNIVSEHVPVEVKETEDTPKKPKRNRGKKKKEDDKGDKEDDVKVEEVEPVLDTQPVEKPQDDAVTPTARKKKNKNKKGPGVAQEQKSDETEVKCEVKIEDNENKPQDIPIQKPDETEHESKSSKKKNKKKKNRNDSERSEKEEISCTSAFQKLLLSEDQKQKDRDDEIFQTNQSSRDKAEDKSDVCTIKSEEINPQTPTEVKSQEEESQKTEGQKNKKKNKKDKKQITTDVLRLAEDIPSDSTQKDVIASPSEIVEESSKSTLVDSKDNVNVTEEIPSTSTSIIEEKSPKLKAKTAKPVEKKKKGKGNTEKPLEEQLESGDDVKISETETVPIPLLQSEAPEALPEQLATPADTSPNWLEEVKAEEGNGPVIGCEEKLDDNTLMTPSIHLEKDKKKKKSPKPARRNDIPVSSEAFSQDALIATPAEVKTFDAPSTSTTPTDHKNEVTEEIQAEPVLPVLPLVGKSEETHEKRQKHKKSPKPSRKNETAAVMTMTAEAKPEIIKTDEDKLPSVSASAELVEKKAAESLTGQPDLSSENIEVKKDEVERIKTPDSDKKHKRKKSPKPSSHAGESSSRYMPEKERRHEINIDDLIIIQAEVVSEDKAQKGDTFIVSEENTSKQDVTEKIEVESRSEKSKKREKSPKPTKREVTESKIDTESTEVKETHAEIQMPITPKPNETKILPETLPVELEKPGEPMPSPSDVTPDVIEYPRCSSEQLLDTNNNMVIQEISHIDSKSEVPIIIPETPFIHSQNLQTPELTPSNIKIKPTETIMKTMDEKTDLKSKVMEVNQDMEELRLSIERSLAELTSLERKDDEIEKNIKEEKPQTLGKSETLVNLPVTEPDIEPCKAKEDHLPPVTEEPISQEPICPERKDRKGKGKSKKKGKQEGTQSSTAQSTSTVAESKESTQAQEAKKDDSSKSEQKSDNTQEKGKQQSSNMKESKDEEASANDGTENKIEPSFEAIENFEDALTSSVDDVNKTFEIIVNEANSRVNVSQNNPEINIIAPQEEDRGGRQEKQNPVTPPKNLLGHPDIPVPSSKTDYKKEKNKTPNCRQAKVKIKDSNQVEIEVPEKLKQSKESQTENKKRLSNFKAADESICVTNKNEDYVYKYSFRKVFLQCACHVCKKDLKQARVPCCYCNLIFYCSQKHKDEDYAQHQAFCFAVSTVVHLKDQKFIYGDARDVTGHNYRLLRMQMIVSCEKVLKRRLAPWEQEALLYPRICADASCREWRQGKLRDCEGCGQLSYCTDHPDHLPKSHARWCKSYNLYRSLVRHQQTLGRLEPKLPTRVLELNPMPDNINEVLANMYEERIDMSDIEYAALTQLATAPLTALYCLQAYNKSCSRLNGTNKKQTLTLHIVGAELQFEADVLNKWEIFLLHLMPDVKELRVVLVGPDLNPSNLPLDLLGKIRVCAHCQQNRRRVSFNFQDKRTYHEFWASDEFTTPDLVCAFNPNIQRSSAYNGRDSWPSTIKCILKLRVPFAITSYTLSELNNDLLRVQECAGVEYKVFCPPKTNSFASVRPDRNFITDDEAPLLFKNHCVTVVGGV